MPERSRVDDFVRTVESGDFVGAIERFYTPGATMQENLGPRRGDRAALMEHERQVMARFESITARAIPPLFVEGDRAVVHWLFEFTGRDGSRLTMDELAYQRWDGDRIAEERFYYDPAQVRPPPKAEG